MNILVIDDDAKFIAQATEVFGGLGHRVVGAPDGKEGMNAFLQGHYGLVLVDVLLPKIPGDEVVQEILKSKRGEKTVCLLVSGIYKQRAAQTQLQTKSGAVGFVAKPLTSERAAAIIKEFASEDRSQSGTTFSIEPGHVTTDGPLNPMELSMVFQQGMLGQLSPYKIIWLMHAHRKSGSLSFKFADTELKLGFHKGELRQTTLTGQRFNFGDLVVKQGYIKQSDLDEVLSRRKDNELIGHLLVQNVMISPHVVDEILHFQQFERLGILCDHEVKSFTFSEGDFSAIKKSEVSLIEVLSDIAQKRVSSDRLRRYFKDLRLLEIRPVRGAELPKELVLKTLQGPMLAVLTQAPPKVVNNWLHQFAKNEDMALRLLFLLEILDQIRLCEPGKRDLKSTSMMKLAMDYEDMNFLERLGLTKAATTQDVKERFRLLSKEYHPDVLDPKSDAATVQAYGRIFDSLTEAYEALSDPTKLEKYKQFGKIIGNEDVSTAENEYLQGQKQFVRKNYGVAKQHYDRAFQLNPASGIYLAHSAWAQLYLLDKNQQNYKIQIEQVLKTIQQARTLSPDSALPLIVLGNYHKFFDQIHEAEEAFRDALDIDPDNRDAHREMRLLTLREAEKTKGLKVFGIKIR